MPPPPGPDAERRPETSPPAGEPSTRPDSIRDSARVRKRCRSLDDLCDEATLRENAFSAMVESGDFDAADAMARNIVRVVQTHLAENELRRGRT